ncbi:MAG: hypothetical protein EXQ52_17215 [Bryobacterales bacterium]|nr:hypothetical protein [Bryobacterales bacterium]
MKILFLCLASVASASDTPYVDAGPLDLPETAGPIAAVAAGLKDRIYVFNRGEVPILVFNSEGRYIKGWGRGLFVTPQGMRVDLLGNIWTADSGNHVVRKFAPDGSLIRTYGEVGVPGDGEGHFRDPRDMAVGGLGRVYVADAGNSRVVRLLRDGAFSAEFGRGQLGTASSVAIDARERIYVADGGHYRVHVFTPEGKRVGEWPGLGNPFGLLVVGEHLLVSDAGANRILQLDMRAAVKNDVHGEIRIAPGASGPRSMTADKQGRLYLVDGEGKSVRKYLKR